MSHSSGPWSISGDLIIGPPTPVPNPKVEPYGKMIAKVLHNYPGGEPRITWKGEGEANARLIAAAPEMLDLLTEAEDYCTGPWTAPEEYLDRLRAIIVKVNIG